MTISIRIKNSTNVCTIRIKNRLSYIHAKTKLMSSISFESNLATKSDEAQNLLFFTFLGHFWRITKENIVIISMDY